MKFDTWVNLIKDNHFTPDFTKEALSLSLEGLIDYGNLVVLDEKLRYYSGSNSPCTVVCPSKPDGKGLWVSQLGIILHESKLPFVTRMYPLTCCTAVGEHYKVSEIVKWAVMGLPRFPDGSHPVLIADARYVDCAGYALLKEQGVHFLASVNPQWFQPLLKVMGEGAKKPGDWVAMHTADKKELFVKAYSPDRKIGVKYLLTTAFAEQSTPLPKCKCPCFDEYSVIFNVLDRFNRRMSGHYWPHRRQTWELAFHDLIFTILLFDVFHLFIEINCHSPAISLSSAMLTLADEMFAYGNSI